MGVTSGSRASSSSRGERARARCRDAAQHSRVSVIQSSRRLPPPRPHRSPSTYTCACLPHLTYKWCEMTDCDDAMAERMSQFKNDPHKMEQANSFVSEVIEEAKDEAAKRMQSKARQTDDGNLRRKAPWQTRARTFISRIVAICFCNNDSKS